MFGLAIYAEIEAQRAFIHRPLIHPLSIVGGEPSETHAMCAYMFIIKVNV